MTPDITNPQWDSTDTEIKNENVKIIRKGHVLLPKGIALEVLCPTTFNRIFVRGRVPVLQSFCAQKEKPSIMSPVIVNITQLYDGEYDWYSGPFESKLGVV